ncbi:MAG: hypothetical protein R2991_10940 [Thermoanaerobaculia bacterium]
MRLADVIARVKRSPGRSCRSSRRPNRHPHADPSGGSGTLRRLALRAPFDPDIQILSPEGLLAPTPGVSFDSLDYTDNLSGSVPPDPELAAGPDHVIAVVNTSFEIYDKSGTSLTGPVAFSSFMGVNPNCTGLFDPNAVYDEETGRFVLGIDSNGTALLLRRALDQRPVDRDLDHLLSHHGQRRAVLRLPSPGRRRRGPLLRRQHVRNSTNAFFDSRAWAIEKAPL